MRMYKIRPTLPVTSEHALRYFSICHGLPQVTETLDAAPGCKGIMGQVYSQENFHEKRSLFKSTSECVDLYYCCLFF